MAARAAADMEMHQRKKRKEPYPFAISIPVHEQPQVVVEQCLNFESFTTDCLIMLHVSPGASFAKDELRAALASAGCVRTMVNEASVRTSWGGIINAHLANVDSLAPYATDETIVAFHSSSDLLLRPAPLDRSTAPRYNAWPVATDGAWYTGRVFLRHPDANGVLSALGIAEPRGGQIEGSAYPLNLLRRLAERIRCSAINVDNWPPVAEEIVFPSYAWAQGCPPQAEPYILMRTSAAGALASSVVPARLRRWSGVERYEAAVNRLLKAAGSWREPARQRRDIEKILRNRRIVLRRWSTGGWSPSHRFAGIRGIRRRLDDPVRRFVAARLAATSGHGGHGAPAGAAPP